MNILVRVLFSEVLVHCQLYELHCLLCSDRGWFARREAVCILQGHFHIAWELGRCVEESKKSKPAEGETNRRNMVRVSLKIRRPFWNSLTLLFRFLLLGAFFRLPSSHRKHLAYLIILYCCVLFVFIASVAVGNNMCALLSTGCHWVVLEVMIYFNEWCPGK